jgi:predicted dithiol-disulfide oxidoreductase (DUF899 family)
MHDPQVVSRDEWLAARRELLAQEKEFTRQRDALNTERRKLPMVEIDKEYIFRGPDGQASLPDLEAFRQRMGWTVPWYSSFGSDFNYDFHVTLDPAVAPVKYNYRDLDELGPDWQGWTGELHGISAFLRRGDRVFHTYSSYARGTDIVNSTYQWLDLTARGRQEDWERPSRRSDGPLMSWLRHHDRYGA